MVRAALLAAHGWDGDAVELVPVTATGDKLLDRRLADIGGKALWTRELDGLLADGQIDAAVHSMKDVETVRPDAFAIMACLPRADVRDCLVGADGIDAVPPGARFGTASPRRSAQLKRIRPDLDVVLLRGNVQTRLAKVESGEIAATLLAKAGLDRLGLAVGTPLAMDQFLPAPSQGIIGIEMRRDSPHAPHIARIGDAATMAAMQAERAFLLAVGGDCHTPVAAHVSRAAQGEAMLEAQLLLPDGREDVRGAAPLRDAGSPAALADALLGAASRELQALFGR